MGSDESQNHDESARSSRPSGEGLRAPSTFAAMRTGNMVVDGRYELSDYLGKGGMGQVWLARDTWLDMQVAIKLLTRATRGYSQAHDRLRAEYKAMSRVSHPNVVRVHGFGRTRIPDLMRGGEVVVDYFTMQLVPEPRRTIEDLLEDGPLPVPAAFRLARGLADALLALDEESIVHGDFKPSNIFVVEADDGLQSLLGDLSSCRLPEHSQEPVSTGTPPYMAPEMIDSALGEKPPDTLSCAADVWAFGTVLFEMFTARKLFPPPQDAKTLSDCARGVRALMNDEHIRGCVDGVEGMSRRVKDMLAHCLALAPDARADVDEIRSALAGP